MALDTLLDKLDEKDSLSQVKKEIFNFILIIMIFFVLFATLLNIGNFFYFKFVGSEIFLGLEPFLLLLISLGLITIKKINSAEYRVSSAIIFTSLIWLATAYGSFRWGAFFYQPLIVYTLIAVISGIILNARASILVSLITGIYLMSLFWLQKEGFLQVEKNLRPPDLFNSLTILATLLSTSFISWMYSYNLQKIISAQKDRLEKAQAEKFTHWQQLMQLGQSSAEIFHDIRNTLTSASLNLELMKDFFNTPKEKNKIDEVFESVQHVGNFIKAVRKQTSDTSKLKEFSPLKETEKALGFLTPKAKENEVDIILKSSFKKLISGSPEKFFQIVVNLVSNAIDSYKGLKKVKDKNVIVNLKRSNSNLVLSVKDKGVGISKSEMNKIFQPFYSTKDKDSNMGLGLYIIKSSTEEHFGGKISALSKKIGSEFIISIPL